LKYLPGHRLIKVTKIITKGMTLRLLLMTGPALAKLANVLVATMTGSCLKSAQMRRLHDANKLPCSAGGLHENVIVRISHFTILEQVNFSI
jgi:hypothetical protein